MVHLWTATARFFMAGVSISLPTRKISLGRCRIWKSLLSGSWPSVFLLVVREVQGVTIKQDTNYVVAVGIDIGSYCGGLIGLVVISVRTSQISYVSG